MNQKKLNNKGFSLVELIIVIAIMAVLVAVLAPQYIKYVESSRAQKDANAVAEVVHACEVAIADETVYDDMPSSGLTLTVTSGTVAISDTIKYSGNTATVPGTEAAGDGSALIQELAAVVTAPTFTSKTHQASTSDSYTIVITYSNNTYQVQPYNSGTYSAAAGGWQ